MGIMKPEKRNPAGIHLSLHSSWCGAESGQKQKSNRLLETDLMHTLKTIPAPTGEKTHNMGTLPVANAHRKTWGYMVQWGTVLLTASIGGGMHAVEHTDMEV